MPRPTWDDRDDPWADTTAHRGEEREDPFDDGSLEGPLGTMSEMLGVPHRTAGTRSPRPVLGSRTLIRVVAGIVFLLVFVVPLVMAVVG